jgi:hypothetical protein
MHQRICLLAGNFLGTDVIRAGIAAYSRKHAAWRLEVHSGADAGVVPWLQRVGYAGTIASTPSAEVAEALRELATPVVGLQRS